MMNYNQPLQQNQYQPQPSYPPQSPYPPHMQNLQQQQQQQQQQQLLQQRAGMMMPQDLAQLAQQGYAQQQAQLAALQRSNGSGMGGMGGMPGGNSGMNMGMGTGMGTPTGMPRESKKKKSRQSPASQLLPRHPQPPPQDQYIKNAMSNPTEQLEPWADGLDEVDGREMAMGRFRARQEILAEIFGGERIKDIPVDERDPWEGLGMNEETILDKVQTLERENEELSSTMDTRLEAWFAKEPQQTPA